ncbi:MAG TPA: ABC transporter ATP-binding protein [Verrucomicrobiae bacterium]|nr:ABC transporter ATP-binding protein [Verrucomicrobiae bacterium]
MKIETRRLLKRYGPLRALDRVSLEIQPGQIVSLLGPNGAGKSTLLRCLAGLIGLDQGEVYYDDELFQRDRLDLRRRFCFVPDFPALFPFAGVLRNLSIFLRLFETPLDGMEERVVGLLRDFDLLAVAEMPMAMLSRGQIYKAALTALLAVDPEVWLLDEPFASGMDPHGINAFKRHARAAASRGRTVLYSTQLLDLAERFSDRVCLIHQGEVRAFDTLAQLRAQAIDPDNVLESLFQQLREEP